MLQSRQNNKKIHKRCITLQLYWNQTLTWVFSCKFAAYFQNTSSLEHRWTAASVSPHHRNIHHCYWDVSDQACPLLSNCSWYFYTHNTGVKFQTKSRFWDTLCEQNASWFWKHFLFSPKNLGNRSSKDKWIQFFQQFEIKKSENGHQKVAPECFACNI